MTPGALSDSVMSTNMNGLAEGLHLLWSLLKTRLTAPPD